MTDTWKERFRSAIDDAKHGRRREALSALEALEPGATQEREARRAVARAVLRAELHPPMEWEPETRSVEEQLLALLENPPSKETELQARYALACLMAAFGEPQHAIDHLTKIVAEQRGFLDAEARLEELQENRDPQWVAVEAWLLLSDL